MGLAHVLDVMESSGHVSLKLSIHFVLIPHKTLNVLQNKIEIAICRLNPQPHLQHDKNLPSFQALPNRPTSSMSPCYESAKFTHSVCSYRCINWKKILFSFSYLNPLEIAHCHTARICIYVRKYYNPFLGKNL